MDNTDEYTKVVVAQKATVADGVVSLTLVDPDDRDLPRWHPGAHIDLELLNGVTRQYSLCGDPHQAKEWRIAVLREAEGAGSCYVHDQVSVGQIIGTRGPRNHFELVHADRLFFLAGGIGITPLLPMIAQAAATGRDWELLYAGRARRSMAFLDVLEAYGDRVRIWPDDEVGMLSVDREMAALRTGAAIYACGPAGLLDAVTEAHRSRPDCSLQIERFGARAQDKADQMPFEVELRRSGLKLQVGADCTLLQALEAAGIQVLSSCRTGTCGTCEVDVLEGRPDHRDDVLSDAEREAGASLMPCVSRSLTPRLVLDL